MHMTDEPIRRPAGSQSAAAHVRRTISGANHMSACRLCQQSIRDRCLSTDVVFYVSTTFTTPLDILDKELRALQIRISVILEADSFTASDLWAIDRGSRHYYRTYTTIVLMGSFLTFTGSLTSFYFLRCSVW